MGIRLLFGRTIEALADELCARLRASRQATDPFDPFRIIIPNRNLELWLKQRIARQLGAAVNIRFDFLENGLRRLIDTSCSGSGSYTDRSELALRILSILIEPIRTHAGVPVFDSPDPANPLFALRDYLSEVSDPTDYSRRLWQLSQRLAGYFLEYENQREDLVAAWRRDVAWLPQNARPDQIRMELAQRALYRQIFVPETPADRPEPTLARALDLLESRLAAESLQSKPETVSIFGLSITAPLYVRCLFTLGRVYDIELYELNVCSEFWEDVSSPSEDRWRRVKSIRMRGVEACSDPETDLLEPNPDDNPILSRWGKLGREKIKLLSELEERSAGHLEFVSSWLDERVDPHRSLLRCVQADIGSRRGARESRVDQDPSIQIVGCPGVYREAEMVRDSIIDNLARHPDLRLTDIAVMAPDIERYKPAILAMFETGPCRLPFSLSDSRASTDSLYAQAVTALLELISGSFSRRRFFDLALNPCFLAGCGLDRTDVETWLEWADRLRVFRFWDAGHKERNAAGGNDRFTWSRSLIRLRLGRIMQPRMGEGGNGETEDYCGYVPHSDLDSQNPDALSRISLTIETLFLELGDLAAVRQTGTLWSHGMIALMRAYLAAPSDMPQEETIMWALTSRLGALETLDDRMEKVGKRPEFGFAFVREFIVSALDELPSTRGRYLAGGISVSALRPMRPVPFRIVYVMGLEEGQFPGRAERCTLDLRLFHRRLGDVCTPDSNRYLFLETLLSTRDKLYLSYQNLDPKQDRPFHPCSVLNELRRYLDVCVLPLDRPFRTLRIPLNGFDPEHLFRGEPDDQAIGDVPARPAPGNLALALDLLSRITGDPDAETARDLLARIKASEIRATPDPAIQAADPAALPEARSVIDLKDLRRFLRDPFDSYLRRFYDMFESETTESILAEYEPIEFDRLDRWGIFDEVIRATFQELPEFTEGYSGKLQAILNRRFKTGDAPDEPFAAWQRGSIEEGLAKLFGESILGGVVNHIQTAGPEDFFRLWIGQTPIHPTPFDRILPAIPVSLPDHPPTHIELRGGPYIMLRQNGQLVIVTATDSAKPKRGPLHKSMLEPYLAILALNSSAMRDNPNRIDSDTIGISAYFNDGSTHVMVNGCCGEDVMHAIIRDYLRSPPPIDLFPFESVWDAWYDLAVSEHTPPEAFRRKLRDRIDDAAADPYSSFHLPGAARIVRDLTVPIDALDRARRWYGHLFEAALSGGSPGKRSHDD